MTAASAIRLAAISLTLTGCSLVGHSRPSPFVVVLTSIAPDPAHHVEVYVAGGAERRLLAAKRQVMSQEGGRHTYYSMSPPDRIGVDWNHDSPPARSAEFDLKAMLTEEGPDAGPIDGIVVLLDGETASLGWFRCPGNAVFGMRDDDCGKFGALTGARFEAVMSQPRPPFVPSFERPPIPEKVR